MSKSPGLYLHIPFCSAICPYCDFAVTTGGEKRRERFTRSLIQEIARDHGPWKAFDTVYLGGGTPSGLADEQLGRILEAVRETLTIGDGTKRAVVSIEANPEDVTEASARTWSRLGIDRLSLGVQSFDAAELKFLGRRHDPVEARRAVEIGLGSGFVVSMDLIYGLPHQLPESWQSNLEIAVALEPHHISCYQLTVERGTPFAKQSRRGDWAEPDDDSLAELFYLTHGFLSAAGYPAYEVSNFARAPETQCAHNRKYWESTPYLGLGPSAHSFDGRSRWWNQRSEAVWQLDVEAGKSPEAGRERLSDRELALERLMLGLRTPTGVDLSGLGLDPSDLLAANRELFERFTRENLLHIDGDRLIPSLDGMARADALARSIEF